MRSTLRSSHYALRLMHYAGPIVVVVLLLAGCSFGSVPRTVKIGLSAPFEGLYRDLGYEALYAVRLAVRERNESGGVGGSYRVELVALNDLNEVKEATGQAAEMAADPGVLAVIGGWSPQTARGVAPEYSRLGLAFLAPPADPQSLGEKAAAVAAQEMHVQRAAILAGVDPTDVSLAREFASDFAALGGLVVFEQPISLGGTPVVQADVAEWLAGDEAGAPDLVFVAADTETASKAIKDLRDSGFRGATLGGPELGSWVGYELSGERSGGTVFVSQIPPMPDDPKFVQGYQALSGGPAPGALGAWAYATAVRTLDGIDAAIRGAGRADRSAVQAALAASLTTEAPATAYLLLSGDPYFPYVPNTP